MIMDYDDDRGMEALQIAVCYFAEEMIVSLA